MRARAITPMKVENLVIDFRSGMGFPAGFAISVYQDLTFFASCGK
ncbi:hypothetical protein Z946_1811 [Sulfitobacter noctilucicola]|nr:hypothetical protein Z946_1811 [Sulfitobacter noctilucicola]